MMSEVGDPEMDETKMDEPKCIPTEEKVFAKLCEFYTQYHKIPGQKILPTNFILQPDVFFC